MMPMVRIAIQRTRRRLLNRAGPSSGSVRGLVSVSGMSPPLIRYRCPALMTLTVAVLEHQHTVGAEALLSYAGDQVADRGAQGESERRGLQLPAGSVVGAAVALHQGRPGDRV